MGNVIHQNKRWANGRLPYIIDELHLSNDPGNPNIAVRRSIDGAIKEWNKAEHRLKVRLVPLTNEPNYISFRFQTIIPSSGSNVGMNRVGPQVIWVSPMTDKPTMLHEIGHALGLYHEQNRQDRDKFVTIDYDNVTILHPLPPPGITPYYKNQFDITADGHDFSGYDFGSIMHYSPFQYAKDSSKPTITSKVAGKTVTDNTQLSAEDVAAVRFIYGERIDKAFGNPVLIQGNIGAPGNFELIVPLNTGKFLLAWRDNSDQFLEWHKGDEWSFPMTGPFPIPGDVYCSMIQGNIQGGNLELIAQRGGRLFAYYRDSHFTWHAGANPITINGATIINAVGNPCLIQNRDNHNLELIAANNNGGITHYYRDAGTFQWHKGGSFGAHPSGFAGPSAVYSEATMIQSSYNNLEVIARAGSKLYVFYRDNATNHWSGGEEIKINGSAINNAAGGPVLIQNRSEPNGNFEMVVPVAGSGIDHYYRDKGTFQWHKGGHFAGEDGLIDQLSFIQSSFSNGNGFEVIARQKATKLYHYFRDGNFKWSKAEEIALV
jgi:hypothetical protein